MGELQVDPTGLKRSARGFTEGAQDLGQTLERLASRLAAEGRCWGTDDVGQRFEATYLPPSREALQMFGQLSRGLATIKARLDAMADNYESAETSSAGSVTGVGRSIGRAVAPPPGQAG